MSGATGVPSGVPRFLAAHLGWILLITFVVTGAAAAFSWTRTPMYQAEADVLVAPRLLSASAAPQPPDMATEKAIVSSGAVISAAAQTLLVPPQALIDGLSVDVPADTQVLQVQYTDGDPREARRRAQGVAEAYVNFHARQRPPRQANGSAAPEDGTSSLVAMVQGVIITPAGVPRDPATPNHPVDVGVALIVGLALGLGTAVVRDRLDDRLRGPEDFEAQSGEPVLVAIPAYRPAGRKPAARLVTVSHPSSRAAAAYRDLRTRVYQTASRRGAQVLLVGTAAGRDKSAVAANLAVALAQSGSHVVLVCADLRQPRIHELLGLDNTVGLTSMVGRGTDPAVPLPAPVQTEVARLRVLPAGPPVADPGAVLQSPVLPPLLQELTRSADLVVVEGPPMLTAAEAAVLLDLVDMVLLTGDFRRITRAQVRAAMRRMEPARAKLIGCVLDNVGLPAYHSQRSAHRSAPADDAGGSPQDNGRYVGRAPSATATGEHGGLYRHTSNPN